MNPPPRENHEHRLPHILYDLFAGVILGKQNGSIKRAKILRQVAIPPQFHTSYSLSPHVTAQNGITEVLTRRPLCVSAYLVVALTYHGFG